jgi:tetratricopeptide (TPR) repeat protein
MLTRKARFRDFSLIAALNRLFAPLRRRPLASLLGLVIVAACGVALAWYLRDQRYLSRGKEALARHDFVGAREQFEAYLSYHSDDVQVRLLAAQAARRAGDLAAAEEHLFVAQRLGDVGDASTLEFALLRAQRGDSAGIESYLHQQQERDPATSALVLEAAAQGAMKKNLPLALGFLDRLLTLQPDHYQGRLLRGRLWHDLHRYENARDDLLRAIELRPEAVEARVLCADTAYQLGHVGEAAGHFEEALQRQRENQQALLGLARCRADEFRLDDADRLLGELLARDPKNAAANAERTRLARITRVTHSERPLADQVHVVCGACHKYPAPDIFPRTVWRQELRQAYDFLRGSTLTIDYPPFEAVARYYEDGAPEQLALPDLGLSKVSADFKRTGLTPPGQPPHPGVANVAAARLFDDRRDDLIVCDMRFGKVQVYQPYLNPPAWRTLAEVPHPCHAEVVDLDGDGRKDLLIADLGDFAPTDERVGRVVWLRQKSDGTFEPITLLERVGRVADVRAADFRGSGKLDLIVAVFGWRGTGEILYLENQTTDWTKPKFVPHVVDERHGTIHVPVADLNGDGKPDFVALISQEHETVVAFINEGNGKFRPEPLYTAPHPAWGSSGIELVDLNGDGKLDVLYTNGDALQKPYILKPYHGVQWLENKGGLKFEHHQLAAMPGAMRAVAADFFGTGRKDIAVVSYLPADDFPQRERLPLASILLLRQTEPGKFERHVIETAACDHLTCCVANIGGRPALVAGNFTVHPARKLPDAITIWQRGP